MIEYVTKTLDGAGISVEVFSNFFSGFTSIIQKTVENLKPLQRTNWNFRLEK